MPASQPARSTTSQGTAVKRHTNAGGPARRRPSSCGAILVGMRAEWPSLSLAVRACVGRVDEVVRLAACVAVLAGGCSLASSDPTTSPSGTDTSASIPHRPLHLPTIAGRCPVSPAVRPTRDFSSSLGVGPLYPAVPPPGTLPVVPVNGTTLEGQAPKGTFVQKVLWFAPPSFEGRVLVRGAEVGGSHHVWFSWNGHVSRSLWLSASSGGSAPGGWRNWPSGTIVGSAAGCYAFQIDGPTFSRVIVFRVKPAVSA